MLQLESADLLASVGYLAGAVSEWRTHVQLLNNRAIQPQCISQFYRVHFLKSLERIRDASKEMEMTASSAAAERAFVECMDLFAEEQHYGAFELQKLISHGDRVVHAFCDEMRARLVFVMEPGQASYYSNSTPLFGEGVEDAFPSASQEISDAGKCRALGRWTACVLHLMRALEPALNALAKHVAVEPDQNWNAALNQIDGKLKAITKSGSGAEAEQWASEASAHFRVIKNAWRNHAAHGRARYDKEQAIAIYDNVSFLMRTLAARLVE